MSGPGRNVSSGLIEAPRVAWQAELVGAAEPVMRRELARTPRGPVPCSRGPHAAGRHCNHGACVSSSASWSSLARKPCLRADHFKGGGLSVAAVSHRIKLEAPHILCRGKELAKSERKMLRGAFRQGGVITAKGFDARLEGRERAQDRDLRPLGCRLRARDRRRQEKGRAEESGGGFEKLA